MSDCRKVVPHGLSRVVLVVFFSGCAQASPAGNGDDDVIHPPDSEYEVSCVNGLDDDGDGDIDCDDMDCADEPQCQARRTERGPGGLCGLRCSHRPAASRPRRHFRRSIQVLL